MCNNYFSLSLCAILYMYVGVCVCREQLRCASTKAVEGESVEPVHRPLFQRFWRWLHDIDDLERWDNPVRKSQLLRVLLSAYYHSLCIWETTLYIHVIYFSVV